MLRLASLCRRKELVLVSFMFAVISSRCATQEELAAVGKTVGAIQFDATIEINPPLSPNCMLLFARYWVSSNYYRVAVLWAEPNGSRMWFPIYPPTLRINSDAESFSVTDDLFPMNNA